MKLLGAKLRGIFAKFSEALPTLLGQGYGGFSSPSSSQHPPKDGSAVAEAARYSVKENKTARRRWIELTRGRYFVRSAASRKTTPLEELPPAALQRVSIGIA
jgi:hypothetical protein